MQEIHMVLVTRNKASTISDSFTVTFKDGCTTFKQGARFLKEEVDLYLYEEEVYFFTKPTLDCPIEQ